MKRDRADRLKDAYDRDMGQRVADTVAFVKALRFSVPLWKAHAVHDRRPCPKCSKRRQFYCYDCLAVSHPETHPAPPTLPLGVHVIFHPGEHRSKSTSLAAATIAPQIKLYDYPTVPEHLNVATTLVLYPAPDAALLDDIGDDLRTFTDVVFVDSTWRQSKQIARDERVVQFRKVRIHQHTSLFWRYQNNDPSYLATVEAIYYCLREYQGNINKQRALTASGSDDDSTLATRPPDAFYRGEVDDLLFYYVNQYIKVQRAYGAAAAEGPARACGSEAAPRPEDSDGPTAAQQKTFTTRHFGGYILEGAEWDRIVQPPEESAT